MAKRKALKASAFAHKNPAPLQSTESASLGAPTQFRHTHRFAVHIAGRLELKGSYRPSPNKYQHRKKPQDASSPSLCSKAGARPSTSAPSCTEQLSLSVLEQQATKIIFKKQLVLKTKHSSPFLRATEHGEPRHEDSLQLKQAESPVHVSSRVPATSQVLPLALTLTCHSEKPGEEEDLLAPVGPIPVQQVCSPVPHCYCSHANPRRHIGARPETITISYNNVRAAPEPSQCRKTPCSFIL